MRSIQQKIQNLKIREKALHQSPYFIYFAHTCFQITSFNDDSWDSAVLPIYQETGLDGLVNDWFIDASLFEQYLQIRSFVYLANLVSLDYYTVHKFFMLLIGPLIIFEVTRLTRLITSNDKKWVLLSGLFVAVYPTWPLSVSSVLDYYLLALWLCLLGCRISFASNRLKNVLGLILVLFSTGYAVLNVLSILFLILNYQYSNMQKQNRKVKIESLKVKTQILWFWTLLILFKFILLRTIFPPRKGFAEYNSVTANLQNFSLLEFLYSIKGFSSFLLYVACLAVPVTAWLIFAKNDFLIQNPNNRLQRRGVVLAFLLVIGSVIPYVLVGKSTSLFWIEFNTGRHAIPLMVTMAIMLSAIGSRLFTNFSEALKGKSLLTLVFSSILLISIFCLTKSINIRLENYRTVNEIRETLNGADFVLEPGLINIYLSNQPNVNLNSLDAALLIYRVTGSLNFYTVVTGDLNQLAKKMPEPDSPLLVRYPIRQGSHNCVTNLTLFKNYSLELSTSSPYTIEKFTSRCDF